MTSIKKHQRIHCISHVRIPVQGRLGNGCRLRFHNDGKFNIGGFLRLPRRANTRHQSRQTKINGDKRAIRRPRSIHTDPPMQQILRNVLFLCRNFLTKTHLLTLMHRNEAFLRQETYRKVSACTPKRKKRSCFSQKRNRAERGLAWSAVWVLPQRGPSDAATSGRTRPATRAWRNRERPGRAWCCQPGLAGCYAARLARMVLITPW